MINERGETLCEKCGVNLTEIRQRTGSPAWPFCPHGAIKGDAERSAYVADEIPGGMVLNNAGPEPVTVYSYTEMNQLFESRGLTRLEKFSPTPGTDTDPAGIPNPAGYMDPVTLANGAELILRAARAEAKEQEDRDFVNKVYRPQPDKVLSESEARTAIRETERREAERAKRR